MHNDEKNMPTVECILNTKNAKLDKTIEKYFARVTLI